MASSDEGDARTPSGKERAGGRLTTTARYCAVYDCIHSFKTHPHIGYFGFPGNKEKVKLWAQKIRRPDIIQPNGFVSSYYRVCEVHFLPRHIKENKSRRRLNQRAVPTRKLPHQGSYVSVVGVPPVMQVKGKTLVRSTLEVFQYLDEAPEEPKFKKRKTGPRPSQVPAPPAAEGFFADCDKYLAPNTAEFVNLVARLHAGRDSIDLCVKLLHSSPQAYRLLQASLGLPTVRTLQRHCASRLPDFDNTVELLKTRVDQMKDLEKLCTLSVEFIDARPHLYYNITFDRIVGLHEIGGKQMPSVATRSAVVTARGLLSKWQQPVALCYLGPSDVAFNRWIDEIICCLRTIGLKILALVCDPLKPPPSRKETPDKPFFTVEDNKIYIIYDPPRLMKKLLCDFMSNDFLFKKTMARWSDVLEYRKVERNKPLTLTPGLTDASIDPKLVRRMKPERAARVLSRSLAAALVSHADQGRLTDSARATANFIIKVNNLYDLLNSTTTKTTSEFKKGLSQDQSQHGFLRYMKLFFNTSKSADLSNVWQITIGAVMALQIDLLPLQPYVLTRHIHMYDGVAKSSANRAARGINPSCQQIFTAFKKQFFHEMLQPRQENGGNLNVMLKRVVSDTATVSRGDPLEMNDELRDSRVNASDYRSLRLSKRRGLTSVATHLLRAASRVHGSCELAAGYTAAPPTPAFVQLVRTLDGVLTGALQDGGGAGGLLRDLLLDAHVLECALPCDCFPLHFVKRLFFRLRLYRLLRHNQRRFMSGQTDVEINSLE